MASVVQVATGWRAQIDVRGRRASRVFKTRRQAQDWAAATEYRFRHERDAGPGHRHTLRDALIRYRDEVAPTKRGERAERIRIARILAHRELPIDTLLADVRPAALADFREARLREVSPGTVLRELGVLSAMFEVARRDWQWISVNPLRDIRKPTKPRHRERLIRWGEIRALLRSLGYRRYGRCGTVTEAAGRAFLAALRTGLRAGELCALRWDQVRPDHLVGVGTKTGARDVALTREARRLIESMRGWDAERVFGIEARTLDALFRRHRQRAGLAGFTFHDARHTAATMLARRLDVLDLCKTFGWSNPRQAMVYYNPSASAIAARL